MDVIELIQKSDALPCLDRGQEKLAYLLLACLGQAQTLQEEILKLRAELQGQDGGKK